MEYVGVIIVNISNHTNNKMGQSFGCPIFLSDNCNVIDN